ncbi:hypothetical protein ACH5RR_001001, partial [Cinchona calisaya]
MVYYGKMHGFMRQVTSYFCPASCRLMCFLVAPTITVFCNGVCFRLILFISLLLSYALFVLSPLFILYFNIISRKYWAKKILEWTTGLEKAPAIAMALNEK